MCHNEDLVQPNNKWIKFFLISEGGKLKKKKGFSVAELFRAFNNYNWCFLKYWLLARYCISCFISILLSPYNNSAAAAAAAKSLQSRPTLQPHRRQPPGSTIPGVLQARTLEWVAISFSNAWKWKVKVKSLSSVWLFTTPWTAAPQAPPSMGFSRQECWSGGPLPSPCIWATLSESN